MNNNLKNIFALLLVLAIAGGGTWYYFYGTEAPVVKLPPTVYVKPGAVVKLTADTKCKTVKWFSCSPNLQVIPYDSKSVIIAGPPGTHRLVGYTAHYNTPSDPAICDIVIGDDPGPGPGPGPGPTPPADPFLTTLNAAFAQETSADKAAKLQQLKALYSEFATTTVNDSNVKTTGQLLSTMHMRTQSVIGNDLPKVRDAIRKELDTKLPTKSATVLDQNTRQLCGTQFQRISNVLGQVK